MEQIYSYAEKARQRIRLLRRGKIAPGNERERAYVQALKGYVRCKMLARKDERRAWLVHGGYLNTAGDFRAKMTEFEEGLITGAYATIKVDPDQHLGAVEK